MRTNIALVLRWHSSLHVLGIGLGLLSCSGSEFESFSSGDSVLELCNGIKVSYRRAPQNSPHQGQVANKYEFLQK